MIYSFFHIRIRWDWVQGNHVFYLLKMREKSEIYQNNEIDAKLSIFYRPSKNGGRSNYTENCYLPGILYTLSHSVLTILLNILNQGYDFAHLVMRLLRLREVIYFAQGSQ